MQKRRDRSKAPFAFNSMLSFADRMHEVPNGRFAVYYEGIPIDFQYEHRDAPVTVVFFHGAVQNSVKLPWFQSAGVMTDVNANWLAISDPTLLLSEDLRLAWYAGSDSQPHLQDAIHTVIERIATITGIKCNLIFYGTSGGGFAALELSHRFPGSLAVPVNPQTALQNHRENTTGEYLDVAFPQADRDLKALPESVRTDLTVLYDGYIPNTVAYLQNSWDTYHINMHALPFFRVMPNDSPIIPGPSNVYFRMGAWGDPSVDTHVPPPKEEVSKILSAFADTRGRWADAMNTLGFFQDTHSADIRDVAAKLNESVDA